LIGIPSAEIERWKPLLESAWRLEPLEAPPVSVGVRPVSKDLLSSLGYSMRELVLDERKQLRQQLHDSAENVNAGCETVPGLIPYVGVGVYASAFGCEIIYPEKIDPWVKPIIDHPRQVYELEPSLDRGQPPMVLRRIEYFQRETGGGMPIRLTDTQDPLDTSALIWGQRGLVTAMHTNPEEAHELLRRVTELIIQFSKVQLEAIENFYSPGHLCAWAPPGSGISVSDDLAAVLSPALYEEFGVPYLTRISEAFNGIYIHSCGDYNHNIGAMLKIPNLRGIDIHSPPEVNLKAARELTRRRIALHVSPGINWETKYPSWRELWDNVTEMTWDGGYGVIYNDAGQDAGEAQEKMRYVKSRCRERKARGDVATTRASS